MPLLKSHKKLADPNSFDESDPDWMRQLQECNSLVHSQFWHVLTEMAITTQVAFVEDAVNLNPELEKSQHAKIAEIRGISSFLDRILDASANFEDVVKKQKQKEKT